MTGFLDLSKACDSIDPNRVFRLLEHCKVELVLRKYIKAVQDEQCFVLKQNQFFNDKISIDRGETQGDIDSPIVFNLLVDTVLREWKKMRISI